LFYVGGTAAIAQIIVMVQSFLLARWLGPDKYAIIVANFSLCSLCSFLVNWGLDTWLLRTSSQQQDQKQLAGIVLVIKMVFGLVWGILLITIAPSLKPLIYLPSILGLAIAGIFVESATNTLYIVFFTTNRFNQSSIILIISRLCRLLVTVLLIILKNDNPLYFVVLRVLVDLVFLGVAWVKIKPDIRIREVGQYRKVFTNALPYSWSDLLSVVYNQSDINIVSFLSDNLQTISFYSLAINLMNVIFAVIQALQNVVIPVLTRLHSQGSRIIKKGSILTIIGFGLLGLALYLVVIVFGRDIVDLALDSTYTVSGTYLVKIAPILLFRSLTIGLTAIIISINQQKLRLIPQTITVLAKILISIAIFPIWQVTGLTWVYIYSELVLMLWYLWIVIWWFVHEIKNQNVTNHQGLIGQ
jgi:O-antigen/teichoic acid export membrane protein